METKKTDLKKKASITPSQVLAVEASAGSGKTYALAKRYIELLLNPAYAKNSIPLKNILAITFTNKATIEMKDRILEMLKKIALDRFENKEERGDIMPVTGLSDKKAAEKASEALEYIIRNYNYYKVQTIDSFVKEILTGCALRLGLSSGFEVGDNSEEYLAYSVDELTEKAEKDGALMKLFEDFIIHYLATGDKPGWFPKEKMRDMLGKLYAASNTYGKDFAETPGAEEMNELKEAILARASRVCAGIPEDKSVNATFTKGLRKFVDENSPDFLVSDLKSCFTKPNIPLNKGGSISKKLEDEWSKLKDDLERLCEAEAFTFYNSYAGLFERTARILRREAEKDDTLFLNELNKQANRLFDEEHVDVPELYYRLAMRFSHYLIDEFQDTSDIQWRNIEPMAEEALASGGTLYFVGDKKQAVFGFRGGNTRLFGSVPAKFRLYNPRRDPLQINYRSCREIVEFNNELFSKENLARFIESQYVTDTDRDTVFTPGHVSEVLGVFEEARQEFLPDRGHGLVRTEYFDAANQEEREGLMKGKLVGLVQELQDRYSKGDIAILSRENADLTTFAEWLIEEGIAVETERTLNIRQNRYVKELISFLNFIHSPINDVAFASFVTGGIFTKASGLKPEVVESLIFSAGNDREKKDFLYIRFREAFRKEWETYLEEPYRNVGHVPLYELTISVLEKFKVAANFPGSGKFMLKLLELIKEREKECDDIGAFLEYFDEAKDEDLFISETGGDSVKLFSIHKSKGLQFPVVIIPYLELQTSPAEKHGPYLLETGDKLALVRLKDGYQNFSARMNRIMTEKEKDQLIGELDVIYVALTRAQRELHVFIPNKAGAGDNKIRALITEPEVGKGDTPDKYKPKPRKGFKDLEIPAPEYADMIDLLKDEMPAEGYLEDRKRFIIGDQAHAALKELGALAGDYETALKAAAKLGALDFPEGRNETELYGVLRELALDKDLKRFFFTEDEVRNEQEIVLASGETKRIDRLLAGKDNVTVIDYKSTRRNPESDMRQVRQYVRAVKEIFAGKTVEGYVIYLDEKKAEKIPDNEK